MAGQTTTTYSAILTKMFRGVAADAVFSNKTFMMFKDLIVGGGNPPMNLGGDDKVSWPVRSAGQTPELFTSATSMPAAGNQTFVTPQVSPIYCRVKASVDRQLLDAMRGSNRGNPTEEEIRFGFLDVSDLLGTSMLTDSTRGLTAIVGGSGGADYGGIDRSANTYWQSYEATSVGTLEMADITTLLKTLVDADRQSQNIKFFLSATQWENYQDLVPPAAQAQTSVLDKLPEWAEGAQFIAGRLAYIVPDLTNTILLALAMDQDWILEMFRDFEVLELGRTQDANDFQLSVGVGFAHKNPIKHGRLSGVTA